MKINKTELRKVFASNTEKNEVHVTSDGHKFFEKTHAVNHGKTLADPAITTVTREEAMADDNDAERLESILARKEQIKSILEQYRPEWEELEKQEGEVRERIAKAEASQEGAGSGEGSSTGSGEGSGETGSTGSGEGAGSGDESGNTQNNSTDENNSAEGAGEPSGKNKNKNAKK